MPDLPPGMYDVRASRIGYRVRVQRVRVTAGETVQVTLTLEAIPVQLAGLQVSVLRPDPQPAGAVAATTTA